MSSYRDRDINIAKPRKIIRNSVICNKCGDEIESKHRHDMRWCGCGNVSVDGGQEYLRRAFRTREFKDTSLYEGDEPNGT